MDDAVALTGMEYGGITPLGLPESWPLLVDAAVAAAPAVVIGSGLRASKLALPGALLAALPGAEVVEGSPARLFRSSGCGVGQAFDDLNVRSGRQTHCAWLNVEFVQRCKRWAGWRQRR